MIFHGTFGSGHLGGFGLNYHVVIDAPTEILVRKILDKAFGSKWSSICPESFNYASKYGTTSLGRLTYTHHNNELDDIYWSNEQ